MVLEDIVIRHPISPFTLLTPGLSSVPKRCVCDPAILWA